MKTIQTKAFILLFILGIVNISVAQSITIKGSIIDLTQDIHIIEMKENKNDTIATIKVKNGTFSGKIAVSKEPKEYRLQIDQLLIAVYLEEGILNISGNINDYNTLKFTGTKTVDEINTYKQSYAVAVKVAEENNKKIGNSEYEILHSKFNKQWALEHPDSYYVFDLIEELYNNYDEVKAYFDNLSPKLKNSVRGLALQKKFKVMKRGAKGMDILNFTLKDINGKDVNIKSYRGKYVLIDFWASWCNPCRAENPNVLAAYNKFKDKNFTVLSISIDDSPEKWKAAIKEDRLPWTQLRDRKNKKSMVIDYYNINAIPSSFLINENGKIIAQDLRGRALEDKLTEVLN